MVVSSSCHHNHYYYNYCSFHRLLHCKAIPSARSGCLFAGNLVFWNNDIINTDGVSVAGIFLSFNDSSFYLIIALLESGARSVYILSSFI